MADYNAWNKAIAAYFTAGTPKGAPIFLSLDEEATEEIAERFLEVAVENDPTSDFLQAVRKQCVNPFTQEVNVTKLQDRLEGIPGGVAFLGLLVLAAYNMHEEEGIDQSNYFIRLRELLALPESRGRPEGLERGDTEPLWRKWNKYLEKNGFQATAERGAGSHKYIRYPLSQAILRESDKQFLQQRFHEARLPQNYDCDQLGFWISRQPITRKHLKEGLHHPNPERVWEFYRAAHRVYETGEWLNTPNRCARSSHKQRRTIECGLYRTQDLKGQVQYYLFPKQPARTESKTLSVNLEGNIGERALRPLRPGFYEPLSPQIPFIDESIEYTVIGDSIITKMIFPSRDFWIVVCDPENPYGAWATWKPYLAIGEHCLVLCREGIFEEEMTRFRKEKLLEWDQSIKVQGWVEYHGCMVLSYDWSGFISSENCQPLAAALTPRSLAGVSLIGGLRDPNQNSWLYGYPPAAKVYGFEKAFEMIVKSSKGESIHHGEIPNQQELSLPATLPPGTYFIEIEWNSRRIAGRTFRISSWEKINEHPEPKEIINKSPTATGGIPLRGAIIL